MIALALLTGTDDTIPRRCRPPIQTALQALKDYLLNCIARS